MFNAFEELFAPGRKHTRDEQKRLELSREDVGDADPGRGPIDLASGKVVVRPAAGDPEDRDGPAGGPDDAGDAPEGPGPDASDGPASP
ncbi:hypothetical protein IGX29_10475 [Streptomyces sp. H28]|uniref:DUF6191 domain-containing protein n=1 Tax=Streptomyces sp. H28 TaxID=2775865 RepID=UPI0017826AE2|nr:DUF6191 domain-containing protein [Streptomyces sp. H28]MBD9732229.1 hypothetical protein [Streptomyces sp. H28]